MSSLEQWGFILTIFAIVVYFTGGNYTSELKKQTKFDKIFEKIWQFLVGFGGYYIGNYRNYYYSNMGCCLAGIFRTYSARR